MEVNNTQAYEETAGYKVGVAFMTFLGACLTATAIGAALGFGMAWISIWLDALYIAFMGLICVAIPALIAKSMIGRRGIPAALAGAISAFVSICVLIWTLEWQGMVWDDNESILSMLPVYGTVAILVGGGLGLTKSKE